MNSIWLITTEQANQRARKALFTCAKIRIYIKREVGEYRPEITVMVREDKADYNHGNNDNGQ